jgi:hypothetical protein
MARFGMIGPSYQSQSLTADCQMTKNWYPETIESSAGKAAMALYPTPGTKLFCTLPGAPVRGQLEINGRTFSVGGTNFCEELADGSVNVIAQVQNDLLPVSMVASPQQLLLASGGALYVYWLQTTIGGTNPQPAGTFLQIPNANFALPGGAVGQPSMVEYIDGFFFVLLRNSQTMYLSLPLDASSWPPLQQITVSVFSDNVQAIVENQRRLWVLGRKRSTVYYDSGSPNIFDVDPSGTIENGIAGVFPFCRADNSVFWLDRDERGQAVVRRASGYTPVRVSNHAIEFAMQGYPTVADCVTYSYQDQGHTFVVFMFPTAQKTWVYDAATGMWHERGYWNLTTGSFSAHKSQNHALAFGKHLVGDPASGNIYQMATPVQSGGGWDFVTDSGNPIRRVRRSPHVSIENKWMFHSELVLDIETGLGPTPPLLDGDGNPRGPQVMLRWSNDYAHTWSNGRILDAGQTGIYKQRVRSARLGRARDRVYEISVTDPIPWRIIEGYLFAEPGYTPTERLSKQFAKVT